MSVTSMNHRTGLDRSQTLLFPERLEDYVAGENPVRFLDAFVGTLDLHALGFAKAKVADTGRPPYDPAVLLREAWRVLASGGRLLAVVPNRARAARGRPRYRGAEARSRPPGPTAPASWSAISPRPARPA